MQARIIPPAVETLLRWKSDAPERAALRLQSAVTLHVAITEAAEERDMETVDRFRGCLIGLAVGDALGA